MTSPYTFKPIWKKPACLFEKELPPEFKEWFLYKGSFSQKIAAFCHHKMRIEVLREELTLAKIASAEYDGFSCRYIFSREIKIYLDQNLLMYAKSVMPKDAKPIYKFRFRQLNTQPLGPRMLFGGKISRSDFEIAKIGPQHPEFLLASPCSIRQAAYLWGRRSVFSSNDQPFLLLTEIFSPDFQNTIKTYEKINSKI